MAAAGAGARGTSLEKIMFNYAGRTLYSPRPTAAPMGSAAAAGPLCAPDSSNYAPICGFANFAGAKPPTGAARRRAQAPHGFARDDRVSLLRDGVCVPDACARRAGL